MSLNLKHAINMTPRIRQFTGQQDNSLAYIYVNMNDINVLFADLPAGKCCKRLEIVLRMF